MFPSCIPQGYVADPLHLRLLEVLAREAPKGPKVLSALESIKRDLSIDPRAEVHPSTVVGGEMCWGCGSLMAYVGGDNGCPKCGSRSLLILNGPNSPQVESLRRWRLDGLPKLREAVRWIPPVATGTTTSTNTATASFIPCPFCDHPLTVPHSHLAH